MKGNRKDGAYTKTTTATRNRAYFHDDEVAAFSIGLTEPSWDGIDFQNHICDPLKLHCVHFQAREFIPQREL
jgi:hypothetical protein